MPKFRVIVELDATDKIEAGDIAAAFTDDGRVTDWKLQRVYGKRKPKPNPNQMTIDELIDLSKENDKKEKP